MNGLLPPGGCLGACVPGTSGRCQGNGSSKIAVGWPLFTAATKLSICSGAQRRGCTASSTSYFSVIGLVGSTCTTSYCFFNSSMISSLRAGVMVCMSNAADTAASVFSTPSFFRFCWLTVAIERTSSYSTGMPRSMNGITTLSSPQVNATPRKISSSVLAPRLRDSTGVARMPNCFSARSASSLNGSTSWIDHSILPPPSACSSRSVESRFSRVCTYASGTFGLT